MCSWNWKFNGLFNLLSISVSAPSIYIVKLVNHLSYWGYSSIDSYFPYISIALIKCGSFCCAYINSWWFSLHCQLFKSKIINMYMKILLICSGILFQSRSVSHWMSTCRPGQGWCHRRPCTGWTWSGSPPRGPCTGGWWWRWRLEGT